MRTLLIATAIVLSVTAAGAQEMTPSQANDRAFPAQPSKNLVEQLKAAGELKDEPKRLEAPAPQLGAAPAQAAPAPTTSAQAAPAPAAAPAQSSQPDKIQILTAKPAEAAPVETKPAETKAVETKPAETKAVETKPAETKAVETRPAETKPAQVATTAKPKKKVVRRYETDEQRARRIAARYGISW